MWIVSYLFTSITSLLYALPLLFILWVVAKWLEYRTREEYYWSWDIADPDSVTRHSYKIDTSPQALKFPKNFLWGVATAAHQVEGGCDNNQWHAFEHKKKSNGSSYVLHGDKSGEACDHWNRFREDIVLIRELGCNSYRFSLEWSKIIPEPGKIDRGALDHYHKVLDHCLLEGEASGLKDELYGGLPAIPLEPCITLFHFTIPNWLEEMGGWESPLAVKHFVEFTKVVFEEYGKRCKLWVTLNEPEGFAYCGWVLGMHPPGYKDNYRRLVRVMSHLMQGHVEAYQLIKSMPYGERTEIGFCKSQFQYDPESRINIIEVIVAYFVNYLVNESMLNFFRHGTYRLLPFLPASYYNPNGPKSFDYVGLNYYSHNVLCMQPPQRWATRGIIATDVPHPDSLLTDMHYTIYPEGFYRAIKQMAGLGKPVYVTENGIADGDDSRRSLFLRRYLYAMHRAVSEGIDVRGYFYWTLMDNFEWADGFSSRFGLYHTDFKTQARTLRPGSLVYRDVVHEWRNGNILESTEIHRKRKPHKRGISSLTNFPPVPMLLLNQRAIMGSVEASVDTLDKISESSENGSPVRFRGRKK